MGLPATVGGKVSAADQNDSAELPVANLAALPASGNWLGRQIATSDSGITHRWSGSAWVANFPTPSVVVTGAGSSSSTAGNVITVTAANTIALDNWMTTAHGRHRIVGVGSALTAAGDLSLQMRTAAPATISTGIYGFWFHTVTGTGTTGSGGNAGTATSAGVGRGDGQGSFEIDLAGAMLAQDTFLLSRSVEQSFFRNGGGVVNAATAYPGVILTFGNSGQWTGTIRVEATI